MISTLKMGVSAYIQVKKFFDCKKEMITSSLSSDSDSGDLSNCHEYKT